MISIAKKEINNGATYKLEVFRNGKCTWEYDFNVTGGDITEEQRDRLAQMALFKEFLKDTETADFYELLNLIPLYKEETK